MDIKNKIKISYSVVENSEVFALCHQAKVYIKLCTFSYVFTLNFVQCLLIVSTVLK